MNKTAYRIDNNLLMIRPKIQNMKRKSEFHFSSPLFNEMDYVKVFFK